MTGGLGIVIRNPSNAIGILAFTLAFTLVAGNALYSQSGSHPDPFWKTRDMALIRSVSVEKGPAIVTRSVLTQSISLKNIPVPVMSPARRHPPSPHSSIVRDVQSALVEIGYYDGKIDGIYGPATAEAIMAYQESAGILPDGEASFRLLSSMKSALLVSKSKKIAANFDVPGDQSQSPVSTASGSALVAKIQKGLAEFGFEEISVDGVMGAQTREAIRDFQTRFALNVTGEADKNTLEKLVQIGALDNI